MENSAWVGGGGASLKLRPSGDGCWLAIGEGDVGLPLSLSVSRSEGMDRNVFL